MALTRPRASQINTADTAISDPLTILNHGAVEANVDIGFILNRGSEDNVALAWQESSKQFVVGTTSSTGGIDANLVIDEYATIRAGYFVGDGSLLTGIIPVAPTSRIDFFTDNVIYKGEAAAGALESDPVWRISKIVFDTTGNVSTTWAGGSNEFTKIWNDRLLYTYS
jgi:hypothetical protein